MININGSEVNKRSKIWPTSLRSSKYLPTTNPITTKKSGLVYPKIRGNDTTNRQENPGWHLSPCEVAVCTQIRTTFNHISIPLYRLIFRSLVYHNRLLWSNSTSHGSPGANSPPIGNFRNMDIDGFNGMISDNSNNTLPNLVSDIFINIFYILVWKDGNTCMQTPPVGVRRNRGRNSLTLRWNAPVCRT